MNIAQRAIEKKKRAKSKPSPSVRTRKAKPATISKVATEEVPVQSVAIETPLSILPVDDPTVSTTEAIPSTPIEEPAATPQVCAPVELPEFVCEPSHLPGADLPPCAAEPAPFPDIDTQFMSPSGISALRRAWSNFASFLKNQGRPKKRLRVCETVSLGEKRFLAIVTVDSESFLLGGSTANVAMLARLENPAAFSSVLKQESGDYRLPQ